MTTFHEQQPQSRRAVRQSERADGSDSQAAFTDAQDPAPQQYSAPTGDMWDTVSRRAAQLPQVSSIPEGTPGRRAATPPVPVAEPLIYSTQSRPAMPSYDGPSFRSRGSSAPNPVPLDTSALPPTEALPKTEQPSYRVRDFSPESRSAHSSRWSEPNPAPTAPVGPATDLDYHTEARFRAAAAAAPLAPISEIPASVAPINRLAALEKPVTLDEAWSAPIPVVEPQPAYVPPTTANLPFEHTLTRRELRAMQQAEEAASLKSQQPDSSRPAMSDPILSSQQPSLSTQQPQVFPLVEPLIGAPPVLPPVSSSPVAPAVAPSFTPAVPAAPVSASPFDSLFLPSAPVQSEPVAELPAELAPAPIVDEPSPWTPPTGHWSMQLDDEDDIETTISRRIGSGTATTSALVLPEIPNGTDIRGPLTSTGEIMLTGSIDLPRNLAATGQSDRYDAGIDELFDLNDAEITSTDSSPVRAIRAVSTHTSGHGVTHTQKPKGTRALTALLIAASSMAVVVAGLLVAAFAFNVF